MCYSTCDKYFLREIFIMKTNIVLVGSIYEKTKEIAEKLSEKYDLYYANVEDILSYRLFNADEIKKKCGDAYLKKLKTNIIGEVGEFENTLICATNSMFLDENNFDKLKNYGTVVFLNFSKKILENISNSCADENDKKAIKVELLTFDEKSKLCKRNSDIIVDLKKDNFSYNFKTVDKILENYFL